MAAGNENEPESANPVEEGPSRAAAMPSRRELLELLDARLGFEGLSLPVEPELPGRTGGFAPLPKLRDAAVLIPLVTRPSGVNFVLTRRPDHLSSHAGQVAFPGGRIDPTDAGPVEAALREAEEEIGLAPSFVDVRGAMAPFATGTGFKIYPVVGLVEAGFEARINVEEVAEEFEVPFGFLMDPANYRVRVGEFRGQERRYYEMLYGGQRIWGATAHIIVTLQGALFETS